ncbi:hypothetical protein GIW79_01270 [Pseudomonas sp. PA-7-1E]|jgi:hypothetical protein|uniref:Uncharacterized protein n=3 Tax=Pseudomonas TaxID=286 RepID=A0A7Y1M6P1_9PSED|nr:MULTISPECIES: hypothetical protein [Pseudomonas]ETK42582.1 hypothetical protein H098_06425 [Pseudomonas fluorescens FH5]MBG6333188.1 hypothetical protein [Pseudomonas aeruginosa]SEB83875.1 hypothetical protein SAMN04490199_2903 [Pseudomonas marginalis]ETK13980.1 hypothetical protein H096_31516 [Pseudomonas sp. FH1]KRC99397.1 hypothetical protein ASE33_23310 [Pseudomonas sp. Root9]|tara:strand:- start:113 stop:337 length:225 start_codon:yes stop_codon:yes gene_type:complete
MSETMTADELNLLLDNIRLEIGYQGEVTTLTLKPRQAEEIDAIKNGLYVEGRTFQFNSATNKLTVDSTNCPVHE